MATLEQAAASTAQQPSYLSDGDTLASWFLTTDHKRIGLLYLASILVFFTLGGLAAAVIRVHLLAPSGALLSAEAYNRFFTAHGIIMVWFFLIPAIPNVLGNFLVPLMLGAEDLAFPRLNLLSWYLFNAGGALVLLALCMGGVDTGWTFYTPYSTMFSQSHVILAVCGIFVSGFSSILTGLNFIATTHLLRAPRLSWGKLPIFIWSNYATSLILVLATPILALVLFLVAIERLWQVGIFDPRYGGDPLLFQHLFWFYSHPAVYIMILPAMGVVTELICAGARNRVFGYKFVAGSSLSIAIFGFLVWGHHMFVSGQSTYASLVFSLLSFLVAVPSGVKVFSWTATLFRGSITLSAPMLYALGFVGLFTIGGLTGLFVASLAVDVHLTDTYFVVAHFHYIMVGGTIMAFLGGLHFWWPKITGRCYPEALARAAAVLIFCGFNLTFLPQFLMGYQGMPRRYFSYPAEFQPYHVLSTAGASILGVGYVLPLFYLLWSLRHGAKAGPNPWSAKGLEWATTSPPPTKNFMIPPAGGAPAYDYRPAPTHGEPGRSGEEVASAYL